MKPPAPLSAEMRTEMARMPLGRMAAMKPAESGLMTLRSFTGSPSKRLLRARAPCSSCMAAGRVVREIMLCLR
jgi:hypothetical protein